MNSTSEDIAAYLNILRHLSDVHIDDFKYIKNVLAQVIRKYEQTGDKVFLVCDIDEKMVGTGSIFFEYKLSHGGFPVGHIEDVVVLPEYRSRGIGEELIRDLIALAKAKNCYKVILNCSDKNIGWYTKLGFSLCENEMRMDL